MIDKTRLEKLINDATEVERLLMLRTMINVVCDDAGYDANDHERKKENCGLFNMLDASGKIIENLYG